MDCLLEDGAGYIWAITRNSNGSIVSIDIIEPVSGTQRRVVLPTDHAVWYKGEKGGDLSRINFVIKTQ